MQSGHKLAIRYISYTHGLLMASVLEPVCFLRYLIAFNNPENCVDKD